MHLSTFGWTPFFEQHSADFRASGMQFGRVNWLSRSLYRLFTELGERRAAFGTPATLYSPHFGPPCGRRLGGFSLLRWRFCHPCGAAAAEQIFAQGCW